MKNIHTFALNQVRKKQSKETGYIHGRIDQVYREKVIGLYENILFVLLLLRSHEIPNVKEARTLLYKLLSFQIQREGLPHYGNFPMHIHDFPYCSNSKEGNHLLFPLQCILSKYGNFLGEELEKQLKMSIGLLIQYMGNDSVPIIHEKKEYIREYARPHFSDFKSKVIPAYFSCVDGDLSFLRAALVPDIETEQCQTDETQVGKTSIIVEKESGIPVLYVPRSAAITVRGKKATRIDKTEKVDIVIEGKHFVVVHSGEGHYSFRLGYGNRKGQIDKSYYERALMIVSEEKNEVDMHIEEVKG